MRRRIPLLSLLLAGAATLAAFGCRDASTPATIAGPAVSNAAPGLDRGHSDDNAYESDDAPGNPQILACSAHDSASASAWVGPAGATLTVGNDRLVIPGNALTDSVLITATIPADTLADIHFAPHGLHFAKDVILVLSANNCNLGNRSPNHVVYLDNSGTVLETLSAVFNGGGHTVTTKIHHFSSYAIAF